MTADALKKELGVLRTVGLWPAIEKGRVPLLARLAHQVAARDDPAAFQRMTSGPPDTRRQAIFDGIKALLADAAADPVTGIPAQASEAISELFALDASSVEATPDKKQRREGAVTKANYQPSYFDKLVREWLERLADRMYEQDEPASDRPNRNPTSPTPVTNRDPSGGDAADDPEIGTTEQASEVTPAQPSESTPMATDPEAVEPTAASDDSPAGTQPEDNRPDSDDAENQDPEIERGRPVTTTPSEPAPKAPSIEIETGTKPPERRDRRGARLIQWLTPWYSAIITYVVAVLVIALAVIVPTGGGASAISGSCGPTTAQLVPQENFNSWAHLYMYAPHQEGAQHGWSGELAYLLDEPKHKEIFHPAETRLVALSYINEEPDMSVIAKVELAGGASIVPNTTCLYRDGDYSKGTRYAKNPLMQAKGLKIEHLASQVHAYITFRERLPTNAPEGSILNTYGWVGPENLHEYEWTHGQARIYLKMT